MYIYNIGVNQFKEIIKNNQTGKLTITYKETNKTVEVLYNAEDKSLYLNRNEVLLETLKWNYGSVRYYFKCPHCGKRAYKLYSRNLDVFVCCKCSTAKKQH